MEFNFSAGHLIELKRHNVVLTDSQLLDVDFMDDIAHLCSRGNPWNRLGHAANTNVLRARTSNNKMDGHGND